MRVLSADQPHAQLMVTRQQCNCRFPEVGCHHSTCGQYRMVKRIHTASYPFPHIGERVAIYATKRHVEHCSQVGTYDVLRQADGDRMVDRHTGRWVELPLGAIVGSCVVTASLPIVESSPFTRQYPKGRVVEFGRHDRLWIGEAREGQWSLSQVYADISDQLPYSDFTPGRHAWLLGEAQPLTAPIPYRTRGGRLPTLPADIEEVIREQLPDLRA